VKKDERKDVDCLIFEDQLDALVEGGLPDEGLKQLRIHALSCPDCSMLLKVKEHLALPSLEKLEEAVPVELMDTIWPRVEGELRGKDGIVESLRPVGIGAPSTLRVPWLVPSLAAASVALLLSTGFLFNALRSTAARGEQLATQITELQQDFDELDARTEWVERTANLAGRGRNRARALSFQFAGQESISVKALVELLQRYPPETILLDASQMRSLIGTTRQPPQELKELLTLLSDALSYRPAPRAVRVGDLAEWLTAADLPDDLALPKASLIELLS
jgi:hypothetical protein